MTNKLTNKKIIEIDKKTIGRSTRAVYFPLVAKKARGSRVWDYDGKEYIDLISSACVLNTGYNHPRIIEAVEKQMKDYIHFANDYFYTKPQVDLARELFKICPGDFEKKAIFGFSGSDAIDSAIKASRAYTGRTKIISFIGAYHGSTYGAISLSAIDPNMKRNIGPLLPEVYHLEYPNILKKPKNQSEEEFSIEAFNSFLENFKYYIPVEEVAAIFIEAIAGDLGIIKAPKLFMEKLSAFCKENGILLVVDEIQQAFGRSGKWLSINHFDLVPDLVVLGKAMASGFPMSCIIGKSEIIDSIKMPGQLFTLQGNPISSVAAIETIGIIKDEKLIDRSNKLGKYIRDRFEKIQENSSIIYDIRQYGLSIGVQLRDKNSRESDLNLVKKICYRSFEKGLILIYLAGNTLRIQPPLVISDEEIEEAMDILEEVFYEYKMGLIDDSVLDKIQGW